MKKLILIMALMVLLVPIVYSLSSVNPIPRGGQIYYSFNENFTNIWNESFDVTTNTGVNLSPNVAQFALSGGGGNASALFAGGEDLQFQHDLQWTLTDEFTISFWFNSTQDVPGDEVVLIKMGLGAIVKIKFAENESIQPEGSCDGSGFQMFTGPAGLNDSLWHHVLLRHDGANLKLWVDNEHRGNLSCNNFNTATGSNNIGSDQDVANFYLGVIDEVKLYNISISEENITCIYNRGSICELTEPDVDWVTPTKTLVVIPPNKSFSFSLKVNDTNRNQTIFTLWNTTGLVNTTVVNNSGSGLFHYNITFFDLTSLAYFVNATHIDGDMFSTVSETITLNTINIDNCSVNSMRALNISVRKDDDNALQNSSIAAYFEVSSNLTDSVRKFNLTWFSGSPQGICIFPNSSSYNISAQFEYGGFGDFNKETHYLNSFNISNRTQFLTLYLTPNGTAVTFTVTDQDDNDVQDVFIHVLRYDFPTNSHLTTEIIKTDEIGEAVGNIVLNTQWYKFLLIFEGVVVLETDPVKIDSTERNFRINLQTNFFDFFDTWDNVQTSLTYTNSTGNFAYTFVNTQGASVTACLNVVKQTSLADILLNETCITGSSGTILINAGELGDDTFKAVGSIEINPSIITDVKFVVGDDAYKKWGKDGIFLAFFVRMGLVTIGVWNPMIAIILLILADVGMISMGLYTMNPQTFIFYLILGVITLYKVNRKS